MKGKRGGGYSVEGEDMWQSCVEIEGFRRLHMY